MPLNEDINSRTSDAERGLGVGTAGNAETLADVLSGVVPLDGLNRQRSVVRDRHTAVVLVRKHQRL